jgi:hypothetical protein
MGDAKNDDLRVGFLGHKENKDPKFQRLARADDSAGTRISSSHFVVSNGARRRLVDFGVGGAHLQVVL